MLRITLFSVLLLVFGSTLSFAQAALLDEMMMLEFMKAHYDVKKTSKGFDFLSKDKFEPEEGIVLSKVNINLEGPFETQPGVLLDDVMTFDINNILGAVALNKNYPPNNRVTDGIGAAKFNVKGQEVGVIEYQIPALRNARFKRVILMHDNRVYNFTMAFLDSSVDIKSSEALKLLVAAAVQSGKL